MRPRVHNKGSSADTADKAAAGALGFTLIELMVVLALIGIVTAMIIPEMRGSYEDSLLRSTAREVVNLVSLASSRAVSQNLVFRLQFESHTGGYRLERQVEGTREDEFRPVEDLPGSSGHLDSRISMVIDNSAKEPRQGNGEAASLPGTGSEQRAPAGTIEFYPDGTADRAEFRLRDRQGFGLALRINPVTARVHIEELERAAAGSTTMGSGR